MGATAVPPLHDYPFHLARADALVALLGQVNHATPYQLGSFLLPNVAMDVVTLALTWVLLSPVAGRVFLALVQIGALRPWLEKQGLGRLPGDLRFRLFGREWFIPLASTLLLSALASLVAKLL